MAAASVPSEAPAHQKAGAIESVRHPAARRVADVLRNRSGRPRIIVIDDAENIGQATTSGLRIDSVYTTSSAASDQCATRPVDDGVHHYLLDDHVANALFGGQKHTRMFALARAPRAWALDDLRGSRGDVVVLDGVRMVGNIGAITRTASALGAAGVIVLDSGLRTTFDRRLIRASRGLVFSLPVVLASRTECAGFLQREKVRIATLSADAESPLHAIRSVTDRIALILGSERDGVSQGFDDLANHRFSIPMKPGVESLNVSVAAGIALYEHAAGQEAASPSG